MNSALHAALNAPLRICPGAPVGANLHNPRQDWAGLLAQRVPLAELPRTFSRAFNLCGQAHHMAAALALHSAGAALPLPPGLSALLHRETLSEHSRRIHLDWPHLLAPHLADAASAALQASPLRAGAAPAPGALRAWQEAHALHMPAAAWVAQWRQAPDAWLAHWAAHGTGWLAALLRQAQPWSLTLAHVPALHLHHDASALAAFAAHALTDTDTAANTSLRPQWQAQCAHTGCWTRSGTAFGATLSTWAMLGHRIAEWLQLAHVLDTFGATDAPVQAGAATTPALAHGVLPLNRRAAIAWVEMARGLLLHMVQLDASATQVQRYRIVAPTEWNFHPQGAVAQALAQCAPGAVPQHPSDDDAPGASTTHAMPHIQLLMAAFDPCVPFVVESAHA